MKHRQVGLEDGSVLIAELNADRIAVALHLTGGLGHGDGQAGQFGVDGTALDEPPRDAKSLAIEDQRLADRDAG